MSGDGPLVPVYGRSTLADLTPSLAARLGLDGARDVLGLPASDRYVLLLVDGLGWYQVRDHLAHAPYLAGLFRKADRLTSAVPSTTATSLSCVGTGLVPGAHGLVGYSFRAPGGGVMNALTWDGAPDPLRVQPLPTLFQSLAASGVATSNVAPARFEASGLTLAGMRGAQFTAVVDEFDHDLRIEQIVAASGRGTRSLVYAYERHLDHTGHSSGVASGQWLAALRLVDALAEDLRDALADDVCLVITGDHGMVDVPQDRRVFLEDHPDLGAELDLFAGEGRLRQLYTSRPDAVAARWTDLMGERAWVLTREEAIAAGWFGHVADRVRDRIGDVLVAMRSDWAVMTRALPRELTLVGMHGSLTADEMTVPLFVDPGRGGGW